MKKQVLFEDTVSYYNKWVQGLAAREFNSQRLKFKDLFNTNHDLVSQGPNDSKADNVLPFPLTDAVTMLGDLTINISNTISNFTQASKHPTVKGNTKAESEINAIIAALTRSQNELNEVFDIIDRYAVVKKEPTA